MNRMRDKVYIGIDPGRDGAMAVLYPEFPRPPLGDPGELVVPFGREEYRKAIVGIVSNPQYHGVSCVVEHVGAMPGQGSVSMFHFGENFGWIQGLLDAYHVPYELVRPQKWKKEFSVTSDKNTSIDVAKRLFPSVDLRRTPKCKGPHDGICEALLMAEYARRRIG